MNLNFSSLIGKSLENLESLAESLGEPKYRGRQLFDWIYRKQIDDYKKMSDLPSSFKKQLMAYPMHPLRLINLNTSKSKNTQKYLFSLKDNKMIESVLMFEGKRLTACLSTQVGCAVGCKFCATAKMGFLQNLTVGEIIDQFLQLQKISQQKITNVVFMGMGEPFLNYTNSLNAAHLLHHPKGINMGSWRITISTAGITKKIRQYSEEKQPFKLAISLNGSNEKQRANIMPLTKKGFFLDLINVAKDYTIKNRKKVTFEYVLLSDVNDNTEDAIKLKYLLNQINCKLNIIPYNEIDGPYKRPSDKSINAFLANLKKVSFPVTVRWSKGQEIDAGCGQLVTSFK